MSLNGLDAALLRNEGEDKLPADTLEGWLKDCGTVPALSVTAGQLTTLLLQDSRDAEFNVLLANLGNDWITPAQKVALFHVYNEIARLYRASKEALEAIDEGMRMTALKEVLRSMFKGEINIIGMTPEGFQAAVQMWITSYRSMSSLPA